MPRVYAAMRGGLLSLSGDPGDWQVRESLTHHDLECVAAHPDRPDRAFAGAFEGGLHRSTDGGATWEQVGAATIGPDGYRSSGGDPEASVTALAVDPGDPDVVWAGTEPSAMYRSEDGGATWEARPGVTDLPSADEWSFPPRPHTHHVRWIAVDPHDADRLYVGIEAGALVRTRDGGETWVDRPPGARRDTHSVATHPDAEGWVYVAAGDGYAESDDRGETWFYPQEGLEHRYCWSVALDPATPGTVLLSAAAGPGAAHGHGGADAAASYLYRRRTGRTWERLEDRGVPTGEGVLRAVLEPGTEGGAFYAANNRGLYRTADAGDSWRRLDVAWPERFETQTARGLVVV